MSERRVLLDAAAFCDSQQGGSFAGLPLDEVRRIVQRFLAACYEDLGKAPRLLDGDDLGVVLTELLPRRFAIKDPLAVATEEVLAAYLEFLGDTEVVSHGYEQRAALTERAPAFREAVASGALHQDGAGLPGKGKTVRHRAAKTGRNDPCPCGSGKKFKKCCG